MAFWPRPVDRAVNWWCAKPLACVHGWLGGRPDVHTSIGLCTWSTARRPLGSWAGRSIGWSTANYAE